MEIKQCFLYLLSITAFCSLNVNATQFSGHSGRVLKKVHIVGNHRTETSIITQELDVKAGDVLTNTDLSESYKRLYNLRIFSDIQFLLTKENSNESALTITVKERWTTIPIAKLKSGGGTTQFTVGAYDINTLGKYIEIGAQYETLNGSPGFVHWLRNPRLFGNRVQFGYDLWSTMRNRFVFTSAVPNGEDAQEIGGYTLNKTKFNFFLDKEFINWFKAGIGADYLKEKVDDSGLGDESTATNLTNNFLIPGSIEEYAFYTYFQFGRINYKNYLVDGFQSDWNFRFANASIGNDNASTRVTQNSRAFYLLPYEQNIGINFSTGFTDSRSKLNQFFVGGLDNVRGYLDGQFAGRNYWQGNLEYRISSLKTHWLTLQNNLFYDVGNVSNEFNKLFSNNPNTPFHSIGAGVRLISPKIYRLNVRIDFAKSLNYNEASGVSFGLQQFF